MTDETVPSGAVAPKFTTELVTQEVLIGQPVTMSCDVIGTPTPDVTWYQVRSSAVNVWHCTFEGSELSRRGQVSRAWCQMPFLTTPAAYFGDSRS